MATACPPSLKRSRFVRSLLLRGSNSSTYMGQEAQGLQGLHAAQVAAAAAALLPRPVQCTLPAGAATGVPSTNPLAQRICMQWALHLVLKLHGQQCQCLRPHASPRSPAGRQVLCAKPPVSRGLRPHQQDAGGQPAGPAEHARHKVRPPFLLSSCLTDVLTALRLLGCRCHRALAPAPAVHACCMLGRLTLLLAYA